jgi:hypothetical protein
LLATDVHSLIRVGGGIEHYVHALQADNHGVQKRILKNNTALLSKRVSHLLAGTTYKLAHDIVP